MLQNAENAIREVDACFENIYQKALDARDRFWEEAKGSGKVLFRGVAVSRRGNSVDIYWLRFSYKKHEHGPQEKPFKSRIAKGSRSYPRFSRMQMGKMEAWLEDMFNRYEDEFEIHRQALKENRQLRRALERHAKLIKRMEG
ncbi:TPA: hypothetical protein VDU83_002472 [Pseudomonas aeruginosa]|nr:hypothetical protein [Pseudomonas aeruginosa]